MSVQKDFGTPTFSKGGSVVDFQKQDNGYLVMLNAALNTGTAKNNLTYEFDWALLGAPDDEFEMYFTCYPVRCDTNSNNLKIPLISLGCGGFTTYTSVPNTFAQPSNIIGTLAFQTVSTSALLRCDEATNPPVYFHQRPTNNIFTLQFLKSDGTGLWNPLTGTFPNYVMTMRFCKIEK